VRLRLADHTFQQVVNVDDVALLAQADRDVFEVNIEGHRLAGDAQDHFERLEDDPAQAGRRLVAPDAYARPPGRRDALRQGGDVHARRGDDQLVNDLLFEGEIVRQQGVGHHLPVGDVEQVVAFVGEDLLHAHAGAGTGAAVAIPIGDSDSHQVFGAAQASGQ